MWASVVWVIHNATSEMDRVIVLAVLVLVTTTVGIQGGIPAGQLSALGTAVNSLILPGLKDFIRRQPPSKSSTPMYGRLTQTPMIWIHLRKAAPILVDKEFYNISSTPGMNVTAEIKVDETAGPKAQPPIPTLQQILPHGSLLETNHKADPVMIENGLFVTMPLRQPPQETFNIAAAENTRTVQGVADYRRKKRETRALIDRFNTVLKQFRDG